MTTYLGWYIPNDIIDFKFTTTGSTGAPTALSAGSVAVYAGSDAAENTSAVTLTIDFDSRTGLNHVRVATSAASTFYVAGSQYEAVITNGSVGGVSVVGYTVGRFNLGYNPMADAILQRSASPSDATAAVYSIYSLIMSALESDISGSTWTIYRSDHVTNHMTRSLSLASAGSVVTGVT
jgi:hypothetical protein